MTEANRRSWKREGAKEDLRREDFWVEAAVETAVEAAVDVEAAGGAETLDVALAVVFLLMVAAGTKECA
jgi:hypothetical protein